MDWFVWKALNIHHNHPVSLLPDDETTLPSFPPRLLCGTQEKKKKKDSVFLLFLCHFDFLSSFLFLSFFCSFRPSSHSTLPHSSSSLHLNYDSLIPHTPFTRQSCSSTVILSLCVTPKAKRHLPSFLYFPPSSTGFSFLLGIIDWLQLLPLFLPLTHLAPVNGFYSIVDIINNNPLGCQCYRDRRWAQQQHPRSPLDPRLSSALYHARLVPPSFKHPITSPTRPIANIPQ